MQNTYYPQQPGQPGYGQPQQPGQPMVAMHQGVQVPVQQNYGQRPVQQPGQPVYVQQPGQPIYGQQPMYAQQPAQPMYAQQPAQPMYGQPQQNRPMNAFGTMNQPPQQNQPQSDMGANTRYGSGNKTQATQEYIQQPGQPCEVVTTPEPIQIPLVGNEYPFLLAANLTLEKQNLGGYFKYIIKGNIMDNNDVSLKIMDVSDEDMVLSQDAICDGFNRSSSVINLKVKAIEEGVENYATEVTNLTEHIIGADTDPKIYITMVNKATTLLELSSLLNLNILNTSSPHTAKFLQDINALLTTKVNEVFKYTLGSDLAVDSFTDDATELIQYIETGMSDAELATKYKYMLNKLFESIKADVKDTDDLYDDIAGVGEKVKITYIPSKVTICNVTSPTITMPLDNIEYGDILAVNEISHPVLYRLIDKIFNGTSFSKGTVLTLTTEKGTYAVRSSTLGYCTVTKV